MRHELQITVLTMIAVIIVAFVTGYLINAGDKYFMVAGWTPVLIVVIHAIILTYKGKI